MHFGKLAWVLVGYVADEVPPIVALTDTSGGCLCHLMLMQNLGPDTQVQKKGHAKSRRGCSIPKETIEIYIDKVAG